MRLECEVVAITCMDYRYQQLFEDWLREHAGAENYDRVAYPGGGLHSEVVVEMVTLAKKLHDVQRAIIINHHDCGAYGENGEDRARHENDLRETKAQIVAAIPDIEVDLYFAKLDERGDGEGEITAVE